MDSYLFTGVVRPERAQLTLRCSLSFSHPTSGAEGVADINIVLNQVAVWIDSDHEWDIFDLRNVVRNVVQSHLAMVGYFKGYAYDLEISRVLNRGRAIDYVFGIDIPCLAERKRKTDLEEAITRLWTGALGPSGIFLHRCFNDLSSAMKHAEDTGFYCYRAIESLRYHYAASHGLSMADRATQWEHFRKAARCTEDVLRELKLAADPLRHGHPVGISSEDRENLLTRTWDVVDGYLDCV